MNTQFVQKDKKILKYEYIAHQINREDGLINNRLTWTLTLNGFLFAALGFLGGKDSADPELFCYFKWVLPLTGFMFSIAGLFGVIGSQNQINYLTKEYEKIKDEYLPRPYGEKKGTCAYYLGRATSTLALIILCLVWVGLLCKWCF